MGVERGEWEGEEDEDRRGRLSRHGGGWEERSRKGRCTHSSTA